MNTRAENTLSDFEGAYYIYNDELANLLNRFSIIAHDDLSHLITMYRATGRRTGEIGKKHLEDLREKLGSHFTFYPNLYDDKLEYLYKALLIINNEELYWHHN